jgi:hypothetical protein
VNWAFPGQGIRCPECNADLEGLDWTQDENQVVTGAQVFPCEHVIPIPPWRFGPSGSRGELRFTKIGE